MRSMGTSWDGNAQNREGHPSDGDQPPRTLDMEFLTSSNDRNPTRIDTAKIIFLAAVGRITTTGEIFQDDQHRRGVPRGGGDDRRPRTGLGPGRPDPGVHAGVAQLLIWRPSPPLLAGPVTTNSAITVTALGCVLEVAARVPPTCGYTTSLGNVLATTTVSTSGPAGRDHAEWGLHADAHQFGGALRAMHDVRASPRMSCP